MATFSSKTFNSALYQSFRPGYNANFFKMLYGYHAKNNGQFEVAVDVGTGTGQVASELAVKFKQVHGVDPSATMLASAVQKPNITYHTSQGEDLSAFPSQSVDLLTVAQALHWFDCPKFFTEVKRVLKPHGTFAAVGYTFVKIDKHPRASQRIFDLGNEPDLLGTYWEPGRLVLDNMYKCIRVPMGDVERYYSPNKELDLPPLLTKTMTLKDFRSYIKTWSSYKKYCDEHPDKPDIVDETIDVIMKEEKFVDEDQVDLYFPTVLILAKNV